MNSESVGPAEWVKAYLVREVRILKHGRNSEIARPAKWA